MNHKMDSVKKLKISKKKRKRAESVDDAKTKKKKSSKPAFSEINFKLSIKDDSYSSKGIALSLKRAPFVRSSGNLVISAHFKVGRLQTRPMQTISLIKVVGLNKVSRKLFDF